MKVVVDLPPGYVRFLRSYGTLGGRSVREEIRAQLIGNAQDLMGQLSENESILLFGEELGPDEVRERFGTLQDKLG